MNKFIYLFALLFLLSCSKNNSDTELESSYKGKLVVKGICMNYVIQVLDSDFEYVVIIYHDHCHEIILYKSG